MCIVRLLFSTMPQVCCPSSVLCLVCLTRCGRMNAGLREYFEEGELRKTGIAMDSTLTCCASEHCHTASMQLSEERADDERTSLLV